MRLSPAPRARASSPRCPRAGTPASRRRRYNTTAFTTDASSRLGITPAAAMRIAEDLYMDGFISYPRTDNTVYPPSLNTRELVSSLVRIPDFDAAAPLLEKSELTATRGKKETTDHPPIYPTQAIYPNALEGPKRRVYELVVRRFLATFSDADDHRVDPRRHQGRLGGLLRPRLRGRRPGLRPHLHLRALRRRRDPEARGGPGARSSTAIRGSSTRRRSPRRGSARAS